MSLTRIGSIGINTGIAFAGVTTIVTLNTANDALSIGATVNVGSGITLGASGDIFATGVCTATSFSGSGANLTGIDTDLVSDTSPQLGGNLDVNTKNIVFGDSGGATDDRLTFGAGTDLSIYHDGSNSFINDGSGSNGLVIQAALLAVKNAAGSENMLVATENGTVELHHDNSKKFETSSAGGTLTGDLTVTGIIYGGSHISILDSDGSSDMLKIGADEDLRIYHYNNNTYIRQHTDKPLVIGGTSTGQSLYLSPKDGEYAAVFKPNAEVELYYDNSLKLETTSGGVEVFGVLQMDDGNSHIKLIDGARIDIGSSADLQIFHSGGENFIRGNASASTLFIDCCNELQIRHLDTDGSNSEKMIVCNDDAGVELYHDSTKQCETSADGLSFPSGKGINFSATANSSGSMSSETLDDYEEGTWTPTLSSGTATVYLNQWYTKVGQVVTCYVYLYNFSDTSSNTHFNISGLPFAHKTNHEATVQFMSNGSASLASNCMGIWGRIGVTGNSDQIAVYTHFNTTGGGIFKHSNLGSTHLMAVFSYVTAS